MRREQALRRQLASLRLLDDAVGAMKSLSAHHLRMARTGLTAARAYRDGVAGLLGPIGLVQSPPPVSTPALLLLAADLGLCNGYNQQLVEAALSQHRAAPGLLYCVGRRPLPALRRAGVDVAKSYNAASSVAGVTRVLLALADDVLGEYLDGRFGTLTVISARFDGVGAFTPTPTRVLPLVPPSTDTAQVALPYGSRLFLVRTAVREYLYSTLYELLVGGLAAEHGARLVATQSASKWLDEQIRGLRRQVADLRREAGTQEVLEVASGARLRRRTMS